VKTTRKVNNMHATQNAFSLEYPRQLVAKDWWEICKYTALQTPLISSCQNQTHKHHGLAEQQHRCSYKEWKRLLVAVLCISKKSKILGYMLFFYKIDCEAFNSNSK